MSNTKKGCSVMDVLNVIANWVVAGCAILAVLWGWFSFRQDLADRARPYVDFRPWAGTWSLFQQPVNDPNHYILELRFELANASRVPAKDIQLSTAPQARTGPQFEPNLVSEKDVSTFMKEEAPVDRLTYKGETWKVHLSPQSRPHIVPLRFEMPKSLYRKYMAAELPNDTLVVYIYTEVSYASIAEKTGKVKYLWKARITKVGKSTSNRDQKDISGWDELKPGLSSNVQLDSTVEWQLVWSNISIG
jgi:hypothetical protein